MRDAATAFSPTADAGYHENERAELVARLPHPLGRTLGQARELIALQWQVLARR